ncbi:MAG: two pore domain potassium channel family protein [Desulfobacterales bacterium]|nr:two pore domain potassium channel family protein [Desulfobacterales bacterium]
MSDKPHFPINRLFYKERFLFLLAFLLLYLGLAPFLKNFIGVTLLMNILITAVFLSAVTAVSRTRRQGVLVSFLALPMLISTWLNYSLHWKNLPAISHGFSILFLVVVIVVILRFVMEARRVTRDMIYAAIVVYLLIGVTAADAYGLLEQLAPGSFNIPEEALGNGFYVFVYYSFATLTTLGYGDISPLTDQARALAIIEAIIGQLYLVVLIARLVGTYISQSEE